MLYTAITDNYDPPRTDIKCFTEYDRFKDPVRNAKIYKVLSHLYIDTEWSIWMDGSGQLPPWRVEQLFEQVKHSLKEVGVFRHPYKRTCIYKEAEECKRLGLDDPKVIDEQMARYRKQGFPEGAGLAACAFIIRKNTPKTNALNEKWWAEICRGSRRDQLSFNYVFRDVFYFKGSYLELNRNAHLKKRNYDFLPADRRPENSVIQTKSA